MLLHVRGAQKPNITITEVLEREPMIEKLISYCYHKMIFRLNLVRGMINMSASQPRNFLSIAIEQHLATMFNAIMNGSLQSKEEALSRLEKYSAQAEKINDTLLRGRIFSVRGTLHLTNGDLSQAEGCYR